MARNGEQRTSTLRFGGGKLIGGHNRSVGDPKTRPYSRNSFRRITAMVLEEELAPAILEEEQIVLQSNFSTPEAAAPASDRMQAFCMRIVSGGRLAGFAIMDDGKRHIFTM